MLVLSRKRQERIQIGPNIWITVVGLNKNGVRLGIEAPEGVRILRSELLLEQDAEAVADDRRHRPGSRSDLVGTAVAQIG